MKTNEFKNVYEKETGSPKKKSENANWRRKNENQKEGSSKKLLKNVKPLCI